MQEKNWKKNGRGKLYQLLNKKSMEQKMAVYEVCIQEFFHEVSKLSAR